MKKHLWLLLAAVSLLGMIIMPCLANSAVLVSPIALPSVIAPKITLPSYPGMPETLSRPAVRLPTPQFNVGTIPSAAVPALAAPMAAAQAVQAQPAAAAAVPAPAIAVRPVFSASAALTRMSAPNNDANRPPSAAKIAALFDGAAKPEPAPVPVQAEPEQSSEPVTVNAADSEDSRLTLPEWDLEQEIGIGQ